MLSDIHVCKDLQNFLSFSLCLKIIIKQTQNLIKYYKYRSMPFPVSARSKAYVCGRSPVGAVGSNPTVVFEVFLL
jgi:hypothetical protein